MYEFYSSSPITGFLLAGYIGTTLYSGALTIIRLNGSKEIGQTNNIKTKELPKWEQRLNKRIGSIPTQGEI
jgi:hypothetical protein